MPSLCNIKLHWFLRNKSNHRCSSSYTDRLPINNQHTLNRCNNQCISSRCNLPNQKMESTILCNPIWTCLRWRPIWTLQPWTPPRCLLDPRFNLPKFLNPRQPSITNTLKPLLVHLSFKLQHQPRMAVLAASSKTSKRKVVTIEKLLRNKLDTKINDRYP